MKKSNVLKIICLALIIACNINREIEFNKIVLNDPVENVYDSILKLNDLLGKLPNPINGDLKNYGFANISNTIKLDLKDDSLLFVNNIKIDENTIDTIQVFLVYTPIEKKEIISLTNYLKNNDLWGAGFGVNGANIWSYDYKGSCERSFNECRTIVALKNLSDTSQIMFGSLDDIIDRKGKLVLCKPKDLSQSK